MKDEAPIPGQAMALNVAANKAQLIHLLAKHLGKLIVQYGKCLVVTGPDPHLIEVGVGILPRAITHEEAGIIMAYNTIEESVGGQSPIRIVSDDTGVLIIITHQPQAGTNKLPATVKVTLEACSGRHKIIAVNAIVKQHVAVIPHVLAAYALTGCDTNSSMTTIGNATVCKRLQTFNERLRLSEGEYLTDEVFTSCQLPVTGSVHRCIWRRCVRRCSKKDCWKVADSFTIVQSAINIACLQTTLPTGPFADSVVERGWHCRTAKP